MTTFHDTNGKEWAIQLDGFALGDLRDQINLDLAGDGLLTIETDPVALVRALAIICRDQITEAQKTEREFAKGISGEVLNVALEAVRGAAQDQLDGLVKRRADAHA